MQDPDNNEIANPYSVKHDMGAMHNAAVASSKLIAATTYLRCTRQSCEAFVQFPT
jgi:hypothetical protein